MGEGGDLVGPLIMEAEDMAKEVMAQDSELKDLQLYPTVT